MTSSLLEPQTAPTVPGHRVRRSGGQIITVIVLVISLATAGVLRQVADARQAQFKTPGQSESRTSLGNMDSFALALLLGGLRGPLVMFLWSTSESQKTEHDLEDFDTKVEWIRLLQPEFDTVAIFQIWNKAYNISAMMASPANRYAVIMEALNFADGYDRQRPGDVNILHAIANVYHGKLGTSTLPEFPFYSRQLREESLTDANRLIAYPDSKQRFVRLDSWKPLLDDTDNIRPDLLVPSHPRPANLDPAAEWNDGSPLQYLKNYQPFPYGLSPLALSYNYAKRAEVAVSAEGQKPLQLSEMVIDSSPGLEMKFWSEDELRRARAAEARAFGLPASETPENLIMRLSTLDPRQIKNLNQRDLKEAIYFYESAGKVSKDGLAEYERHLAKPEYLLRRPTYESHLGDLEAAHRMCDADGAFLAAQIEPNIQAEKHLLTLASDSYAGAAMWYEHNALQTATEYPALKKALPPGYSGKGDIAKLPEYLLDQVFDRAMDLAASLPPAAQDHADERAEFGRSVNRCRARLKLINDQMHAIADEK